MRIAIINTIKPVPGSGDGMTEYAYQLYDRFRRKNKVDLIYSLEESKRNDVKGNIAVHSIFKSKVKRLAKENYDIIHITTQELGFAAKLLKRAGSKAKIVTSVHDLMRLADHEKRDFHKGIMQSAFNYLVSSSIKDAMAYSDMIIFSGSTVEKDSNRRFQLNNWRTTPLGPKESFRRAKIPDKKIGKHFNIGYVGALAFRKNVIFMLKTAMLLKERSNYKFIVWGSGAEKQNLHDFKEEHKLDNVSFMGFAPEKDLLKIYDSFDLFFYPTLEEGSSLPILDAQARGLPVLVYTGNHIDVEIIRCCLVAKNPQEAARIINRLATKGYEPKLRARSTKYARSFSWDRVAKETFEAYKDLTRHKAS